MSDSEEFAEFESFSDASMDEYDDEPLSSTGNTSFKIITLAEVVEKQHGLAQSVSDTLQTHYDCSIALLHSNKWEEEIVISKYFDDPNYTNSLELPDYRQIGLHQVMVDLCILCCEEDLNGYHLGCGHQVCEGCFKNYLEWKIEDREPYDLKCPGDSDCKFTMTEDIVKTLLPESTKWRNFLKLRAEMFLPFRRAEFCGCPTPDCKFYVEALEPISRLPVDINRGTAYDEAIVTCNCTCSFCFLCGESHLPVSCDVASAWLRLSNDASFIWIQSNTKSCPKCMTPIEKNNGCDHMSCRCGYHFCWACLGEFLNYSHKCSRLPAPKEEASARGKAVLNTRLLHYAPRITSQLGHRRLHLEALSKAKNASENYIDPLNEFYETLSTERGTLLDAHKTLAKVRGLIAWTFVLMLFLRGNNERTILEDCTLDLQNAAEQLGRLLVNKKNTPSAGELETRTSYVEQRHTVLLAHVTTRAWEFEPYMQDILAGKEL